MPEYGRRTFLKQTIAGAACITASWHHKAIATPSKPNIVIIVADDLGWHDVGYHGGEIRTPRIDALAKEGIELDRFYVCPVCSPTRAGLMTGRYPHRYGLRRTVIPPWRDFGLSTDEECLPQLLAEAGYTKRACFGKWHLGHSQRAYHPVSRGFTHFYGHYNGAIDYFTHQREDELDWHRNYESCYDKGYSTTLLGEEAVSFIKTSSSSEPFLLYVPFNAPHSPLQAEEEMLSSYGYKEAKGLYDDNDNGYGREGKGNTKRQTYAAMVTALDTAVGNILDALDAKGIAENTLVLFFSDNGGAVKFGGNNKPLRGAKHTVWEGGVRVPAIIRWPKKLQGGKKVDAMMGYIDVLPTVLAATAETIETKNALDGINVLPVLSGSEGLQERTFYLGQHAVVTQEWKLIDGQLYHISKDPNETRNVAADNPEIVKQLQEDLSAFEKIASKEQVPDYGEGRKGFKAPKEWDINQYHAKE